MLAGFFIREIFKPVQKLFLPSSLIGGLLLLLLGHQAMGIIAVPESFHELPGVLIDIVMASLVFGVNFNREKISSYLDYSCVTMTSYGMQMCLGVGLGWILSKIWTGLPQGWGVMGVFSFHGGHGTAAATASAFQKLGVDGNRKSASLYDMIPAVPQNQNPFGEWNKAKIMVYKGTVVHGQNDKNVVEYHLWTPQWTEMLENSKFSSEKWPLAFELLNNCGGENHEGYIGLQDHGDDVWFRNIRVKILD